MTDEFASYEKVGREFANHDTLNHSANQFAKFGGFAHTNTAEWRFQPYEARSFRHASLDQRSSVAALPRGMGFQVEHVEGIDGKRLTYRQTNKAAHA